MNLKNSYGLLTDEPLTFTNFTPEFNGIIDYIWHRPSNLTVTGMLGSVPPDYSKQFVGFPTQHMPSDHIPLLVEFKLEVTNSPQVSVLLQPAPGEYNSSHSSSNISGRRLYSRNKSAIS